MALLDVSEVISDPLFTSCVTLIRTQETIDEYGEPIWTDVEKLDVQAVVTSDQKTIDRLPEALKRSGTILVRFLKTAAPNYQGKGFDAVLWRGRRFVVKDAADYSHFGSGFIRMVCWPEEVSDGGY